MLTANLLAATGVHAQDASAPQPYSPDPSLVSGKASNDDTLTDQGLTRIDTAVLFYQEAGGRVRTIEPVVSGVMNGTDGSQLSVKLTSDTLTGATPNGAAPWRGVQTFLTPAHAPGTSATVTGSSGGSTIVTIPGKGTVARQYTTAPGVLPVDPGFKDQRYAIDVGYSAPLDATSTVSFGAGGSVERDYTSVSISAGFSRDFNQKNTTVSLGTNLEFDISRPYFGTPRAYTVMSGDPKGANQTKVVPDLVLGVTQVINRRWLAQLNYSVGLSQGYQTDPYRVLSVVDPVTGGPVEYLYEKRPNSRLRQSVYFGNKIAIGPTFADVSARLYHDSWGINSVTLALAERVPITSWLYVEPSARYYSQTAASFFRNYLVSGQTLPGNASSDSRLGKFNALTVGAKVGLKVGETGELYLLGEDYRQAGVSHPAGAIGDLAHENLFSGINAASVVVGYTFAFY